MSEPSPTPRRIDLNADLGEGFGRWSLGDDDALLDIVTSANVACGFHAGDPSIMRRVCAGAAARGVVVGAQVSYRDLAGFGRRRISIPAAELCADIVYQIGGLDACARAEGTRVRYVKAHGALNNVTVTDEVQAQALVEAIRAVDGALPLLVHAGSALDRLARAVGVPTVAEAYPDRAYEADGSLRARSLPGAVLDDVDSITFRAVRFALGRDVPAVGGEVLRLQARSLCLHGDNPAAVQAARSVARALAEHGVQLAPFVEPP